MAELKTKPNRSSVERFVRAVTDEERRRDCQAMIRMMSEVTGAEPEMWGTSIVGFGRYHYKYASGREADWMLLGFSPRKKDLTLYVMAGFEDFPELMQKLGRYKTGTSCLYLRKLEDVDTKVLRKLLKGSVKKTSKYRTDN